MSSQNTAVSTQRNSYTHNKLAMCLLCFLERKSEAEFHTGLKTSLNKQPTNLLTSASLRGSEWLSGALLPTGVNPQQSETPSNVSVPTYSPTSRVVRSQIIWCFIHRKLFQLPATAPCHSTNDNAMTKARVNAASRGLFLSWTNSKGALVTTAIALTSKRNKELNRSLRQ